MLRVRSLISRGWMVHGFGLTDTINATIMNFECKQLMSHLEKDHQFGEGDVLTVSQAATIDEETIVRQNLPPMTMHWNSPRKPSQAAYLQLAPGQMSSEETAQNTYDQESKENEIEKTIQKQGGKYKTKESPGRAFRRCQVPQED